MERLRVISRLLPYRGVQDQEYLVRLDTFRHLPKLVDEVLAQAVPTRRVHDHDITLVLECLHTFDGHLDGVINVLHVDWDIYLFGQLTQLLTRRGTIRVRTDEPDTVSLPLEVSGQFRGRGGFTHTVQSDEHDDVHVAGEVDVEAFRLLTSKKLHELLVHYPQ